MSRSEHVHALAHKLPQVVRNWQRLADAALAEFRVSNSAGWCLVYLDRLGPDVRQTDLAEQLGITQPSLVRTLHQLQAMGFVDRLSHPKDKRANRLVLTDAGQALAAQIDARLAEVSEQLLDGVPDAAIEISLNLLELLTRRIAERRQS